MEYQISSKGSLGYFHEGRQVASAESPLEMEKEGKIYQAGLRPGPGGLKGLLVDAKGPFLSCEFTFQKKSFHGLSTLVEKRRYRALRPLSKTLLSIRYFLDPVKKQEDGFLVIPTLWYGDNEGWHNRVDYPRGLNKNWSFRADGSSCPAVVWTTPTASYAVATNHSVPFTVNRPGLDDVLGIGFSQMEKKPQAVFTFPAQEVPQSYPLIRKMAKAKTPKVSWKKGQILEITLYHSASPSDRSFHAKVWRAHYERTAKPYRYSLSNPKLLETAGLFTHCMKESHFVQEKGFKHRHDMLEIFSGWCGGFAAAKAAMDWGEWTGDPVFSRMGETMADFLCREGVSKCGIFYSEYAQGCWMDKVFWGQAKGLHMRNASEGACYLALMLEKERSKGHYRPYWERALKLNLDAVLSLQRADGAIPHEINGKTGKPLSWIGATSGTWLGALAVYSRTTEDKAAARVYLTAAKRTADYYLKNYVLKERFIGGPYDAYMAPNMEDPYNLLMAYAELYQTTKEKKWLSVVKRIADHLLSWRYLYDVRFPDGTICLREKVKTFHMSPASVSNKHIQNWDTLADVYLLRLSDWLKDPFYADCAKQHLMASTQLVQKGQLPKGIPYGGQSEQWYATEINFFGDCGNYNKGNLWQISVVLPKSGFLLSLREWLSRNPVPAGSSPRSAQKKTKQLMVTS